MHKEIKSNSCILYIEGENISTLLLSYFEAAVFEIEKFLLSDELQLNGETFSEVECTLSFSDSESMQVLNKNFRQIDKVTDVLSFPVHESLRLSAESFGSFGSIELGDVIICSDVAAVQADKFNITYEQEVIHLFIHGLLHLVGFDHEISDEEEETMLKHEDRLVKKIYQKLGLENE